MSIKDELIDFSDCSAGKNSAFPRHALQSNQVVDTLNVLHESVGISRAPGYRGITDTRIFADPVDGMWSYVHDDGSESCIAVSGAKIYNIDLLNNTKTEIGAGTITVTGECYAVNAGGKLWIVNGTDFVKVEDDLSAYRVQIVAPTGASAAASAGGSLATGVYGVYVAYARKNAAGQYLYSLPQSLGNITTSGGNLSIAVTCSNSTDPQVTHKVVFMTDAGGALVYYYGEATNATATVIISSATNKLSSVLMSTVSAANQILPITPSGIYTFDDKIYVWDINNRTIYWSLKTDVNPFDMERFLPANFRTMSMTINAVFSVGADLFFNHLGNGVSVAYAGDMSSIIKLVQKSFWYLDTKVPIGKSNVVFHKGVAFGLTNDGFRFFDGTNFSEDISFHIKPDVDKIYTKLSVLPSACVYRRAGKRTEYRFSYCNTDYGFAGCNDQRIFNLDFYFDPMASKKTWECWENGFSNQVTIGGTWYGAQSYSDGGQIVKEQGSNDIYCYARTGTFLATEQLVKQVYILSRTIIDALDSITVWGSVYALATAGGSLSGNLIIFDDNNTKYPFLIKGVNSTTAVLPSEASGGGLILPFIMQPQFPIGTSSPMPFTCRGNSVAMEISQVEDDVNFFIYKIQLPRAKQIKHNLT